MKKSKMNKKVTFKDSHRSCKGHSKKTKDLFSCVYGVLNDAVGVYLIFSKDWSVCFGLTGI